MTASTTSAERPWRAHLLPLAILAIALLVSFIVRIRLLGAPLERDEGEHGYLAQVMLAGYPPWQLAYNLKLPGTDALYAAFLAIFGQTAVAIRLGLLLVNTATVLLVARLGKRIFGFGAGAVAGASYALLSCGQGVVGTVAHSTHFVVFFAVIATLQLLRAGDRAGLLFLAGLTYGIAFLMKQPGLAFAAFGALFVVWRNVWRRKQARPGCTTQPGVVAEIPDAAGGAGRAARALRGLAGLATFSLGVALPYALLCLALWRAGTFARFWFWTVTLTGAYATKVSFALSRAYFAVTFPYAVESNLFLWILAGAGLALACWNRSTRRAGLFVGALLVFSALAVSAGGSFNPNYFILMFPALALANGAWVAAGNDLILRIAARRPGVAMPRLIGTVPLLCFALACLYPMVMKHAYLFSMSTFEFERSSYGVNPFPEAEKVAEYIRSHSDPGARIAVLGSEAEIYFYSRRQAATGYLFTYGLMETHRYALPSQREMIREIESARPEYLVFVGAKTSWMATEQSSREILNWAIDYIGRYYDQVGVVDLAVPDSPTYIWGYDAAYYQRKSDYYLNVYLRR